MFTTKFDIISFMILHGKHTHAVVCNEYALCAREETATNIALEGHLVLVLFDEDKYYD